MNHIDNTNFAKRLSKEEAERKRFDLAYLIQTNQHHPLFNILKDMIFPTFKIVAKFEYLGYNGQEIIANSQVLVYRCKKQGAIHLGTNVVVHENNLNNKGGGSNKYPSVAFEGAWCIIEFISYGLPTVDVINGWKLEIIEITNID